VAEVQNLLKFFRAPPSGPPLCELNAMITTCLSGWSPQPTLVPYATSLWPLVDHLKDLLAAHSAAVSKKHASWHNYADLRVERRQGK
jgi:hypothetical protein